MRRLLPLLLAALAPVWAPAAAPEAFPSYKDLAPPPAASGGLACVALDDDVLSALNGRRTNLRLRGADGQEVPYLLRTRSEVLAAREEGATRAAVLAFRERPGNRAEVIVSRAANAAGDAVALVLHSAQTDYEKQVDVYGSADREVWTPLATNQALFDYSRYIDVQNRRIALPPNAWPFYRIDIANLSEDRRLALTEVIRQVDGSRATVMETESARVRREPFRVDAIDLVTVRETAQERRPVLKMWEIAEFRVDRDPTARATRVEFDTRRQPLVDVSLQTASRNFSRRAVAAGTDDGGPHAAWTPVGSATLTSVDIPSAAQQQLDISFGGPRRYARYRITIQDGDNPPLDIRGLRARGETWEAVFFPPGGPVQMVYGGPSDVQPDFDIAAVLGSAADQPAEAWTAGPQFPNAAYRPDAAPRRGSGRALMVVAIVAMVAALFVVIARAVRRLEPPPA